MPLFTVTCTTCTARLSVRDTAVIGQILECPKCGSMVQIVPPEGWQPPQPTTPPAKSVVPPARSIAFAPPGPQPSVTQPPSSAAPREAVHPKPSQRQTTERSAHPAPAPPHSAAAPKPPRHAKQAELAQLAEMAEAGLDLEAVASPYVATPIEQHSPLDDGDHSAFAPRPNRRRLIVIASCAAALAVMAMVTWTFWPRTTPIETPEPTPMADTSEPPLVTSSKTSDPVAAPKKERERPALQPRPAGFDPRWLPPGTRTVLSLRLQEILRQDELGQLLRRADPLWRHGLRPLARGLDLAVEEIQRVTWAATNPADLPRESVIVVELSQRLSDNDAARWLEGAVRCDFKLGEAPCHRREKGEWLHPFALVDQRTLVTGPNALMRAMAQAATGAVRTASTVCEQLLTLVEADRELVLLADTESLRATNVDLPAVWLADHGELRDYWQAVRALPRGVALQGSFASGLTIDAAALCASEVAAAGAQAGLEKLLRTLSSVLASEAEPFLKRPDAAEIDSAVFTAASVALSRPKAGCRGDVAWVQCSLSTEVTQLAATAWATWKLWEFIHRPPERSDPRLAVDLSGLDRKLPAVEYAQAALAGFVEDMSRLANVPIAIDLDALTEAGLGQEMKVSVKRADTTVAFALRAAIEPLGLDYVLDPEGLLITTKNRLRDEPRMVEYDVSDLANDAAAIKSLTELCRRMVEPASWDSPRAQASIKVAGNKLQIQQAGSVHDDLLLLFEKLRVARGRPPQRLTGIKLQTRFARVSDSLLKEVTANFSQPTPLPRIADYLSQRAGIKVLVDRVALHKAGIDASEGVRVTAEKEPLRDVLSKVCDALEIGWRIVDEKTLQMTSRAAASRGELELYDVADLLAGESGDALAARIRSSKGSETWGPAGGQGSLQYDPASRHLIVFQSPAIHLQIEDFLATERAKKNGRTEVGAPAKGAPTNKASK